MADTWKTDDDVRHKTQDKNDIPPDVLKEKGAKQYPNYYAWKTRAGHNIILDDSEGYESITIQHRSGTELQWMPDGALVFRVNKGKYEEVSGQNIVKITGKSDISVDGDASR